MEERFPSQAVGGVFQPLTAGYSGKPQELWKPLRSSEHTGIPSAFNIKRLRGKSVSPPATWAQLSVLLDLLAQISSKAHRISSGLNTQTIRL